LSSSHEAIAETEKLNRQAASSKLRIYDSFSI
jgi:hypothetical protein